LSLEDRDFASDASVRVFEATGFSSSPCGGDTSSTITAIRLRGEREMAAVVSRGARFEGFWEITEPEIAAAFEGRDFALFRSYAGRPRPAQDHQARR
jgi:hypothetical protein